MDSQTIFWIVLVVIVFGLIALWAIYKFGHSLFGRFFAREWPDFFMHYGPGPNQLPPRSVVDLITDFRERRNDFWLAYGQIVIALIIAVLLTVLLLTKTISAEAGLPILSAISGFAIAKGTTATRNRAPDDNPNRG
jgi:hypothetical protein